MNLKDTQIKIIHIGKCGGTTILEILKKNKINCESFHINKIKFNKDDKYLILLRNPIQRFISAFNWRYKLVVIDGSQKDRFNGEKDILISYGSVNNLSENIDNFDDNINYIHHIKENINYYLEDILLKCNKENIIGVITLENINNDIENFFGVNVDIHKNKNTENIEKKLSVKGYENLKKYLKKDYECIDNLYVLGCLTDEQYFILSK